MKFIITFQAIQNYIPDTNGNQLPNTIDNSLKIFNSFENDAASVPISMFDVTTTNGKLTLNLKAGVIYPETMVLPTQDENGNAITHLSSTFASNTSIKKLVVPSTYTSMDESCFYNNKTIQSVDLSQSNITTIPTGAFQNSSIQTAKLPNNLSVLDRNAFAGSQLTSVSIPEGVTEIGAGALYNTQLVSLYIPSTVKNIGGMAIYSPKLKRIVVSDANSYFYTFYDNVLASYDGRLIYLAPAAYIGVSHFDIPEGIKVLDTYSLWSNYYITSVSFPTTLEKIQSLPYRIQNIDIGLNTNFYTTNGHDLIDINGNFYVLMSGYAHEEYILPSTVKILYYQGGVSNSLLKKFVISENVENIPEAIFLEVPNLVSIVFENDVPPTMSLTFTNNLSNKSQLKIYVPDSAVATYKAVANLANYKDRIYPISELSS